MNTRLYILAVFSCMLSLTSCTAFFTSLYGMKKQKPIDEKDIVRYSKKYHIPLTDSYELKAASDTFLSSLDSAGYSIQKKNHKQPLQALYYNQQTGQLHTFITNCYAGGFPNLKWNRNNIMSTFPPQQQTPVDSIVPLNLQLSFLQPLSQTSTFTPANYDYIVIVHWSRFMGRQSKRLIREVQQNSKLAPQQKIKLIYVNNDDLFAEE